MWQFPGKTAIKILEKLIESDSNFTDSDWCILNEYFAETNGPYVSQMLCVIIFKPLVSAEEWVKYEQ